MLASPLSPTCLAAQAVADEVAEHLPALAERRGLDASLLLAALSVAPVDWQAADVYEPMQAEPGSTDLRGRCARLVSPGRFPSGFRPLRGLHPAGALRVAASAAGPRPAFRHRAASWRPSRTPRDHASRWIQAEAERRMSARDPDDWPTVALALTRSLPIWSQDKDMEASGVSVYTTGDLLDAIRDAEVAG